MNPNSPSPPLKHSKTNGNISGKITLQDGSLMTGGLRQNLFQENGLSSVCKWAGCSAPQSCCWARFQGSQVIKQVFKG